MLNSKFRLWCCSHQCLRCHPRPSPLCCRFCCSFNCLRCCCCRRRRCCIRFGNCCPCFCWRHFARDYSRMSEKRIARDLSPIEVCRLHHWRSLDFGPRCRILLHTIRSGYWDVVHEPRPISHRQCGKVPPSCLPVTACRCDSNNDLSKEDDEFRLDWYFWSLYIIHFDHFRWRIGYKQNDVYNVWIFESFPFSV